MKTLQISCTVIVAIAMLMFAAVPAQADFWSLNNDWTLGSTPFGPSSAWNVTKNAAVPAPAGDAFVDGSANYFTPAGCVGAACSEQWIAGYANAAAAVFKVYDNLTPSVSGGETVKPAESMSPVHSL